MLTHSPKFTTLFHPNVLALLDKRKIEELYPPQWQALQAGLNGKNLIISIPTASGKTLIAELLAFQILHTSPEKKRGKILYLCPLKALAQEKYHEFREIWHKFGFRVGISTSDIDQTNLQIFKNDLIILTNEKADSILRLKPSLHQQIAMVICDEIHLINDSSRGTTLEFLLTRFRVNNPKAQIIGLSATIKNAHDLAGWLEGELITSTWRPVPLKEGYYLNDAIHFITDGTMQRVPLLPNLDEVSTLTIDIKKENGQALIFTNSRRSAMAGAERLAQDLRIIATKDEKKCYSEVHKEYLDCYDDGTKISERLGEVLAQGVAFHHAGMVGDQLKFIVNKFSNRQISAIVCTPTLSAGVNTPARRVIIKTLYRFSVESGIQPIPIMEYKQMAGRAGRPRFDPYGEVIILGSKPKRLVENAFDYIKGEPEDISSKLSSEGILEGHVLSLIVSKTARTSEEILHFLQHTFHYYLLLNYGHPKSDQQDHSIQHITKSEIQAIIRESKIRAAMQRTGGRGGDPYKYFDRTESFTTASEMHKEETEALISPKIKPQNNEGEIHDYFDRELISPILEYFQENSIVESDRITPSQTNQLIATKLGKIITQSYLPPKDAIILLQKLKLAQKLQENHEKTLNAVSWLHVLTQPKKVRKFYLRKQDYPGIISFRDIHMDNFIMETVWKPVDPQFEEFGKHIKLTQILFDWISEHPDRDIVEQYNIGSGDLRRSVDNALWILRILRQIVRLDENFPGNESFKSLYMRLQHGILPNLIPFVQIKGIGRVRARKLYRAGFTTLAKLKSASVDDLALVPLIGDTLSLKIKGHINQANKKQSKMDGNLVSGKFNEESILARDSRKKNRKKKGLDAFL
jgi:helicase